MTKTFMPFTEAVQAVNATTNSLAAAYANAHCDSHRFDPEVKSFVLGTLISHLAGALNYMSRKDAEAFLAEITRTNALMADRLSAKLD